VGRILPSQKPGRHTRQRHAARFPRLSTGRGMGLDRDSPWIRKGSMVTPPLPWHRQTGPGATPIPSQKGLAPTARILSPFLVPVVAVLPILPPVPSVHCSSSLGSRLCPDYKSFDPSSIVLTKTDLEYPPVHCAQAPAQNGPTGPIMGGGH